MKKLLGIIVFVMLTILIVVVALNMNKGINYSLAENEKITQNKNVEFLVSEANNKSLKYTIKNNSKEDIIYGEDYEIQKYIEDAWNKYDLVVDFIEIAYVLKPNKQSEEEVIFATIYGNLDSGKYRIIKYINNEKMAAEFTIE